MPEIIADIFFLHDRGKWNTLYWVVYMVRAPLLSYRDETDDPYRVP